jgi:hypothetical protein
MAIQSSIDRLLADLRSMRTGERGNVLLTFALMLVPLVGAVGAAVDFSRANNIRSQLQAAADAASVATVAKNSPAVTAAASMSSDGEIKAGESYAITFFNSQLVGKTSHFNNLKVTADVRTKNGQVTASVKFDANVPAVILGIFSKGSIPISGIAKAATGMPSYIDFHLLLDNSPSMGLAATTADINTMVANTPDQCAFACHETDKSPKDYYHLAKKLGVQMRIDVLRSATEQLMDTAKSSEAVKNQFRAAIYTFGASCTNPGLTTITAPTSNLSSAKSAAKNIDLMTIPYQNYNDNQCTNFDSVLTDINSVIAKPGSGDTSSSPQKYLFLVSDGVNDANNPSSCAKPLSGGTRCQEPIDTSFCTTIKNRGIKIAVLYTTYLPLPTNEWYNTWIAPWQNEIRPRMKECASPDLFFEVSPSQGISEALTALFNKAVAQARLTQ